MNYKFISKSLYFPDKGILVIGDLHIGYEYALQQAGVLLPERQIKDLIKELKSLFQQVKSHGKLDKIVFLGDIKHAFGYEYKEKVSFRELFEFLSKHFKEKDTILIKGNHDTIDYSFEEKMSFYHIENDICFLHGDKLFPEAFEKNIKLIVMGHIHPSIILSDKQNIKRESYKCFLEGKFKNKQVVILPSFLEYTDGSPINNMEDYEDDFSIIPKKALLTFKVHVIGENEVYEFGKVKDLK